MENQTFKSTELIKGTRYFLDGLKDVSGVFSHIKDGRVYFTDFKEERPQIMPYLEKNGDDTDFNQQLFDIWAVEKV